MRAPRAMVAILISLAAMDLGGASAPPEVGRPPEARFPASLIDIDGKRLDLEALARDKNLVVVTLKATWCPVCPTQLVRLRERLPDLLRCEVDPPCMLQILPDGRIGSRQLGRNGAYFGDAELEEFFDCTRAA